MTQELLNLMALLKFNSRNGHKNAIFANAR